MSTTYLLLWDENFITNLFRDSRYLMVQTEEQYAYIHLALVEFFKAGDTEIDASELRDYIKKKSEVDISTGEIFLQSIYTIYLYCL